MAITAQHLTFSYGGGRETLSDLNFRIEYGECVGLIGANGAGKSTLLKLLMGLLSGYEGDVCVGGLRVEKKNLKEIRRLAGYVFQDSESQLFLSTVYEDVAFGPRNDGCSKEEVEARVMDALRQVHMEALKEEQIYRLSGGQKKLASIATILSMKPQIILLDEPSGALDPRNRKHLIQIIRNLQGTKVVASHDLDLILDICERTLLIADGKIVRDGRTEEILGDEALLVRYGLELPLSVEGRRGFYPLERHRQE